MRADTGVGPSSAWGSQTYSGICADLPVAPRNRSRVIAVARPVVRTPLSRSSGTFAKTSVEGGQPKEQKTRNTRTRVERADMQQVEADEVPGGGAFVGYVPHGVNVDDDPGAGHEQGHHRGE